MNDYRKIIYDWLLAILCMHKRKSRKLCSWTCRRTNERSKLWPWRSVTSLELVLGLACVSLLTLVFFCSWVSTSARIQSVLFFENWKCSLAPLCWGRKFKYLDEVLYILSEQKHLAHSTLEVGIGIKWHLLRNISSLDSNKASSCTVEKYSFPFIFTINESSRLSK